MSYCRSTLLLLTEIEVDMVGVRADGARDVRLLTAPARAVGACNVQAPRPGRRGGW